MWTRWLIEVRMDRKHRVGQYCQWDCYPSWQGIQILEFLRSADLSVFKEKLKSVEFAEEEESQKIREAGWVEKEAFSRNTWSDILSLIYEWKVTKLADQVDFKEDWLFCEWCFLIDLDENTYSMNWELFKLDNLPSNKEFLERFDKEDE